MKTERQLERTDLELYAIEDASVSARYYFKPKNKPAWREYLQFFEGRLLDEMHYRIVDR
jgi:hypothetical protein